VARIVQEALVNVRKHSLATRVEVTLSSDEEGLILTIEDDGTGARLADTDSEETISENGWEPVVIRERVRLLNGSLRVESRTGPGVCLVIRIPASAQTKWWGAARS